MFLIEFDTDNAAFERYPAIEICRILQCVVDWLEYGLKELPETKRLIDINGNDVGFARWTK